MSKRFKRVISMILSFSMILSYAFTSIAYADEIGDSADVNDTNLNWGYPVVQINNEVIRVTADKQTGRFITETLSGLPNKSADDYQDLLYGNRFEGPETSYTSVRIDGEDYIYGNNYGFLGLEGHYTSVPYVDLDTNSIISEWSIKDIVITQRLSLMNNPKLSSIGNVYATYDIVNKGTQSKSVGIRMLLDTKIGSVDSPVLTVPGDGFIYKEKEYVGDEIPSMWYALEKYVTPQVIAMGAVSGEGLSKPDKLQFAAWGDVSQTKWDYTVDPTKQIIKVTVDGQPYDEENGIYPDNATIDYAVKDSCAVMYWNPVELEAGETTSIDTAYGVGDASIKDNDPGYRISLQGTDKLNMKADKSGYTIDYVNAEFNIDNNFDTSKNIDNLQIDLELPDELELVEGDQKTVIKTLTVGSYQRSMWKIRPVVQDKFTISAYSVLVRAEGMPAQRITKVLIMEGKDGGLPEITFLDSTPKIPFYKEDISRSVFINGSGFDSFGGAIGQVMEAKLIQGSKTFTIDWSTFRKISDTVISVGVPDNVPVGTYDLFISVSDATSNKNDKKTFKNAVVISDDIKYSYNLISKIEFPIVMKDDGYNTPEETVTIYGKFIDNKNGTYTSIDSTVENPVKINNALKFARGTLMVNTNPEDASIEASDGVLWCDIVNERNKTSVQAVIATAGFKFEETSKIGDEDTKVRMIYEVEGSGSSYDVSYKNVPVSLDEVIITKEGIDIKGSMGILNPLTYGTNDFTPSSNINKAVGDSLSDLAVGYFEADVDNISVNQDGMDIEGKFAFEMPFVMSLFAGANAVLEVNTKQEHFVVEVAVSLGDMVEESAGAKARIGFRKGRFDEIYVGADFPTPYTVAPPIPIGISGFSGGLKNLSFAGAFPITIIVGIAIEDSTGIEFMGYNLLSAEGEIAFSPFHLEGEAEADLYMMDLAEVSAKFVWATWDPEIEKRGIRIDATIHYRIFKGNIYISYFDGEGFLGRATLSISVPSVVPVIGGLDLAGVIAEVTEYSIAGSVFVLEISVGVRYYFSTGKTEFLELKEELEKSGNGIIMEYDNNCIVQYGYNFIPLEYIQYADEDSQFITELNLTNNSNVMLVLRMTKEQFDKLDENSIRLVKPGTGGVLDIRYINNTELLNSDGTVNNPIVGENEIVAIKQVIDMSEQELANEYMVSIPIASPDNGQWTVVTNSSMEVLPFSEMKNPEITNFNASYNSINSTITANWKLEGEPDKFRFYIVNADEVNNETVNNPPALWGTGTLLYGQTNITKDYVEPTTGKIIQVEDEIIYTKPTADGEDGTVTTKQLNLPTGSYYIYAKADKENTVADYKVCQVEVTNPNTPDAPTGLLVKDIGNNQISISWDADYNMNQFYIYRKESVGAKYDISTPVVVYNVYDPDDYEPLYENWPGNLPKEKLQRFEVVIDGDELDEINPQNKKYYFDIRAIGTNPDVVVNKLPLVQKDSIPNVTSSSGTIGVPASGSVNVLVPEEIIAYSEVKSADSKIVQQSYVEKDNDGIEQRYYKYVTNSSHIIISGNTNIPVKYKIQQDGKNLDSTITEFTTSFSENTTLKEGINYFIINYENEHGDRLVEEYVVEFDNKAPTLVITEPKEGAVSTDGKITVIGTTDPYAIVTINNVNYDADEDGNFNTEIDFNTAYLSKLNFEVRDSANNVTKKEISVLNDLAEITDISIIPEFKFMTTNTTQKLSTYISKDDNLGEKLIDSSVKYSIIQGGQFASISDDGVLTARYDGTVIVKSEFFVTDSASISDSIVIDISGDKRPSSKYYPPVYSKELLTWLAGSEMSTKGGTIKTNDGVILEVPEGALLYYLDNVDIFVFKDIQSLLDRMNIPSGAFSVSQPYYINLVTDFAKPAKLTLPVSNAGNAYVYYYDEEIGTLIYKGGEMSADKKSVTANITKPGTYIALNNPMQDIFRDIASDYWGYDYIYGLNFLNIINGYNVNNEVIFNPNANITRAEFIKLLVVTQNINLSEAEDVELKFSDNNSLPSWALIYIKAAVMNGLINGKQVDNKNYFAPSDYITREEIATIIGRSLDSEKKSKKLFNDSSSISSWALEEVSKLVDLGIISGYNDNTFKPRNNASRTEASVMIYNYLKQFR